MIYKQNLKNLNELLRRSRAITSKATTQLKELKACLEEDEFKAVQEIKVLKETAESLSDNGVYFLELVEYLEAEMRKDPTFDFGSQE
jgi:hypothetical protein